MNGNEVGQGDTGLEPDGPVGVVEGLHECRLQLREERLEEGSGLLEERGQSVEHSRLDAVTESVSKNPGWADSIKLLDF